MLTIPSSVLAQAWSCFQNLGFFIYIFIMHFPTEKLPSSPHRGCSMKMLLYYMSNPICCWFYELVDVSALTKSLFYVPGFQNSLLKFIKAPANRFQSSLFCQPPSTFEYFHTRKQKNDLFTSFESSLAAIDIIEVSLFSPSPHSTNDLRSLFIILLELVVLRNFKGLLHQSSKVGSR